eukprot:364046-Chlamydomonas_euryale.AAC.2
MRGLGRPTEERGSRPAEGGGACRSLQKPEKACQSRHAEAGLPKPTEACSTRNRKHGGNCRTDMNKHGQT